MQPQDLFFMWKNKMHWQSTSKSNTSHHCTIIFLFIPLQSRYQTRQHRHYCNLYSSSISIFSGREAGTTVSSSSMSRRGELTRPAANSSRTQEHAKYISRPWSCFLSCYFPLFLCQSLSPHAETHRQVTTVNFTPTLYELQACYEIITRLSYWCFCNLFWEVISALLARQHNSGFFINQFCIWAHHCTTCRALDAIKKQHLFPCHVVKLTYCTFWTVSKIFFYRLHMKNVTPPNQQCGIFTARCHYLSIAPVGVLDGSKKNRGMSQINPVVQSELHKQSAIPWRRAQGSYLRKQYTECELSAM